MIASSVTETAVARLCLLARLAECAVYQPDRLSVRVDGVDTKIAVSVSYCSLRLATRFSFVATASGDVAYICIDGDPAFSMGTSITAGCHYDMSVAFSIPNLAPAA